MWKLNYPRFLVQISVESSLKKFPLVGKSQEALDWLYPKNNQYPINENKNSEYIVVVEKHVRKVAYLNCYCFEQGFEQFSLYFRIFFFGVKILRYTTESIRNEKQLLINTKFNIFAVQYWASSEIWLLRARVWPKSKRIWQILNICYWILKFQGTLEMGMHFTQKPAMSKEDCLK